MGKTFLKALFLFSIAISFYSCQKDEEFLFNEETKSNKRLYTQRVNVNEVPFLENFLNSKMSGFKTKSFNKHTYIETPIGDFPLENVLETTDFDQSKSYSFRLIPKNIFIDSRVYNLIVSNVKGSKGEVRAYIAEVEREVHLDKRTQKIYRINKYPLDEVLSKMNTKASYCPDLESLGEILGSSPCEVINISDDGTDGTLGDNSSGGGSSENDIDIPTPDTIELDDAIITITGDQENTSSEDTDTVPGAPGCWVITEAYMDEDGVDHIKWEYFDPCPEGYESKSQQNVNFKADSSCSDPSQSVGIDLYGIDVDSMPFDEYDFLKVNCPEAAIMSFFWNTSNKGIEDQKLMSLMTRLFMAYPDSNQDMTLIRDVINAINTGQITTDAAQLILKGSTLYSLLM